MEMNGSLVKPFLTMIFCFSLVVDIEGSVQSFGILLFFSFQFCQSTKTNLTTWCGRLLFPFF